MDRLSAHVLDTSRGAPAAGMRIDLAMLEAERWRPMKSVLANADARTDLPLLADAAMAAGQYRLVFHVAEYFRARGVQLSEPAFLDRVPIRFGIDDPNGRFHVPLLCSPWIYSTSRGS